MYTLARFLALLLAATVVGARADDSLACVRRAQQMLGPDCWSRVIGIANEARASRYPRTLHALVFEFGGILWFYTETDGTQSFSLRRGGLAEEKADFRPLLRDIEPGFVRWWVVADDRPVTVRGGDGPLRNGCFVASVAALQALRATGTIVAYARLLSFHVATTDGREGHTVLTYAQSGCVVVIDPAETDKPQIFPAAFGEDALALARALEGTRVVKARWVPADLPRAAAGTARAAGERSTAASQQIAVLR